MMETLLTTSKIEVVKRKLGFDVCFIFDPVGRSGALTLMWKSEINFVDHNFSLRHISGCETIEGQPEVSEMNLEIIV